MRLAHCRENPYQLLTDWVPDPEPATVVRHEVQRQLDLVASVGMHAADERLSFRPRDEDEPKAVAKLRAAGVDLGEPWMVVHPGASAASRNIRVASGAGGVRDKRFLRTTWISLQMALSSATKS